MDFEFSARTKDLQRRLQAFMDGKLRISGDVTLFMLHETLITQLSQQTAMET